MAQNGKEHQLGDFIKGRLQFIQDYCENNGLNLETSFADIQKEAVRLAGDPERQEYLEKRLFSGSILSSSFLPDWVDKVFLEAMTKVLKGMHAKLYTSTSEESCIPFEAGRFNARRQAETVFKLLYQGKRPEVWMKTTFPVLYLKCYGDDAAKHLKVEETGPGHFRVTTDNRDLEKASPMDCSTVIGYLFGSLEMLGAERPLVTHDICGIKPGSPSGVCVFEVSWK